MSLGFDVERAIVGAGAAHAASWPAVVQDIVAGNFGSVLAMGLPGLPGTFADFVWHQALSAILPAYLAADASHVANVFYFGVAATQLFMQMNATGPALVVGGAQCPAPERDSEWTAWAEAVLASDGEVLQPTILCPGYLALARLTLVTALAPYAPFIMTLPVWIARVLVLQQRCLEANAAAVHSQLTGALAQIQSSAALMEDGEMAAGLHLEVAMALLLQNQVPAAKVAVDAAGAALGLMYSMEGALGVRTRFQREARAQLFVCATPAAREPLPVPRSVARLPQRAPLTDDTLLANGINFSEAQSPAVLSLLEQSLLIAAALHLQKSRASDDFMSEEVMAFTARTLEHPTHWAPTFKGLLMQSVLEKGNARRTPRALQQLELLVAAFDEKEPAVNVRQQGFFAVFYPLQHELELLLAEVGTEANYRVNLMAVVQFQLFLSLPRDAIPLFEKLQSWENLIHCYRLTDQNHRAEGLIRERLSVMETPSLWCALGDVTENHVHYQTAWELSSHRSARAQRSLGVWNLSKAERASALKLPARDFYLAAIHAFELSLGLNTFQDGLWFSLGCAALRVEDFPAATHAFRRKTELDPENFEAWSNLASAHVRLKNYDKAYSALKEAVKGGHDMWRVWANLCVVSVDVGAFRDVIRAITRLLELGQAFNDPVVLKILSNAVTQGLPDISGNSAALLGPQMDALVALLKSSTKLTAASWLVLAEHHAAAGQTAATLAAARTAFQEARSVPQWERSDTHATLVTCALEGVVRATLAAGDASLVRPTRLVVKPVLAALVKAADLGHAAPATPALLERMQSLLTDIEAVLAQSF